MLSNYSQNLNSASEKKDANWMHLVEWLRKASGESAAKTYITIWKETEEVRKEFEESGYNLFFRSAK
jgi:glucose-6-phosphate isomerase